MTIKPLEPERYPELGIPVSPFARVVIIEDNDGSIAGYAVGQPVWHLEPMWVREDLRKGMEAVKLWAGALAYMQVDGITGFYTQASTDEHADYLIRLGLKPLPYVPFEGTVPPKEGE